MKVSPLLNELLKVKVKKASQESTSGMVRVSPTLFSKLVDSRIINAMGHLLSDVSVTVITDRNLTSEQVVPVKMIIK